VSSVSAPVLKSPEEGCVPDQPPPAVQVLVFAESQVSVLVPLTATSAGEALNVTLGPLELAFTMTSANPPPPAPEQLSLKRVSRVIFAMVSEPERDLTPDQPPDDWHSVALNARQVRVTEPPGSTTVADTERLTLAGAVDAEFLTTVL